MKHLEWGRRWRYESYSTAVLETITGKRSIDLIFLVNESGKGGQVNAEMMVIFFHGLVGNRHVGPGMKMLSKIIIAN